MNISEIEVSATGVDFDSDNMWVKLADGRKLGVPLAYFPRLLHATSRQRRIFTISGGGTGLHWDDLDEDISVKSLIMGIGDRTKPRVSRRSKAGKSFRSNRWRSGRKIKNPLLRKNA